jgi:hypothetical protein
MTKRNTGLTTPNFDGTGSNLDPKLDEPSIDRIDWTLFDAQGYIEQRGVRVHKNDDNTISINRTLHLTEDLTISDDCRRIDGKAGWYLTR